MMPGQPPQPGQPMMNGQGGPQPGPPQPPPPNPALQKAQQQLQQIQQQLEQIQENKQVLQLLRDEKTRGYRVEIETDSTIEPDEQAEKKSRIEFTEISGKFLGEALPILQVMPQAAPMFEQVFMFLVRGFRAGRELEDTIEQTMAAIGQAAQQPKPDPEQQKVEAQLKQGAEQHQQTMQQSAQQHQQKMDQDAQLGQIKLALEQEKGQQAREQHTHTLEAADRQAQRDEQNHGMEIEAKQEDRQTARDTAQLQFEGMDREQTRAGEKHGMDMKAKEDAGIQANAGELKQVISELATTVETVVQKVDTAAEELKEAVDGIKSEMAAPAEIVRGSDGRAMGIKKGKRQRSIKRGPDGSIAGLQ